MTIIQSIIFSNAHQFFLLIHDLQYSKYMHLLLNLSFLFVLFSYPYYLFQEPMLTFFKNILNYIYIKHQNYIYNQTNKYIHKGNHHKINSTIPIIIAQSLQRLFKQTLYYYLILNSYSSKDLSYLSYLLVFSLCSSCYSFLALK